MQKAFILGLLLCCGQAFGDAEPTILVFGDSLSAGYGMEVDQSWAALLQQRVRSLGYEYRVVNASITGETTEGGVERIHSALRRFKPALLIVELGGNDGLRGFPPDRMGENLGKIVAAGRQSGAAVVLLGIRIPPNYGPRYSAAFDTAFRDLATREAIPWVEFFMEGVALNPELMQDDGIHPTAEAQARLLDNAWPVIRDALEQRQQAGTLAN